MTDYDSLLQRGAIDVAPEFLDMADCVRLVYKVGIIVERGNSKAVDCHYLPASNEGK